VKEVEGETDIMGIVARTLHSLAAVPMEETVATVRMVGTEAMVVMEGMEAI
jgi:hypothetical protein